MELLLQLIFGTLAMICLTGGTILFFKGAGRFIEASIPPQPKLDNIFRFLSGMYFAFGFMLIWFIFHITTTTSIIYFIGFVVMCAGFGRFYSSRKVGSPSKYHTFIMYVEMGIGLSLMLLQYLR
ncbi:MAG: DUF4345 domain-containing protein [Cytophaga sp.]